MNMISPPPPLPATVFRPEGVTSLADVRDRVEALPAGNERRDTLSAFRVLARRLELDLAATAASAVAVRKLFESNGPKALKVNARRHANIRSLVGSAVARFGMRPRLLARSAALSAEWAALLERAQLPAFRQGVRRLAHYCSAMGIAPEAVRSETLLGLHEAIEAESMTKAPREIVTRVITDWNWSARRIPSWPPTILASPWKREPDALPMACFPAGFQADVAAWIERASPSDPLDPFAPFDGARKSSGALRPVTIRGYAIGFRRFASALVRRGLALIEQITGLAAFFEGARLQGGLRHFLRPGKNPDDPAPDTSQAYQIACALLHAARHHLRVAPEVEAEIAWACERLKPKGPKVMGERNRKVLDQFDQPENVALLLGFPQAEAARAMRLKNPRRRAGGMERALAAALLIDSCVRINNLRHIRPDADLRRIAGEMHLTVKADDVKNGEALAFVLGEETAELLERFLKEHRAHLPGHEGPYLFPGRTGGARSDNAMRAAIARALLTRCGLKMTPHLFRHAIAKIVVERDPSMYTAVSRHLGHRSMSTTLASYLGTETRAAGRRLNRILREARDDPSLGED